MTRALNLLATRARTVSELEFRLTRAGASTETARAVCSRLLELCYLDDASFARRWAEERIRLRPVGRRLLLQELLKKGVPAETARRTLAGYDGDAELAAARRLVARQWGRLAGEDPAERRRRCYRYLLGRGFDHEVSAAAVRSHEDGEDGGECGEGVAAGNAAGRQKC